jgi:hypothetical protein
MENIYQKTWRDKKAQELKDISDHKERTEVWKKHKKDDVPFLFTYEPEYTESRFDTAEAKNYDIFVVIPNIEKTLNTICSNGELFIDYNSKIQQKAFFKIAELLGKKFGDAGLKEFESIGLKVCLRFFLETLKSKIKPDLSLVEDYNKYIDEITDLYSHRVAKIVGVFFPISPRYEKIRKIFSKHYLYFQGKVNQGDFNMEDHKQMTEYNDGVSSFVDELLENDEMKFNLSDEFMHFKNMFNDLKSKMSKNISKV